MGREIRRVPANWQHPMIDKPNYRRNIMDQVYQPLYDREFAPAMREWIAEWDAWERGERPSYCSDENKNMQFWEWSGPPPDPTYYRPAWKPEDMTWYQVYETVSEGTPVTPPFATREELVEYLVANGDFWDQKRRAEGNSFMECAPWKRKDAEAFVFGGGYAPSLVVIDGKVMSGVEALTAT